MTLSMVNENKMKDIKSILQGLDIAYPSGNMDYELEKIKTGIPLIDKHHKILLELVLSIFQMLESKTLYEEKLKAVIEDLIVYSLEHFIHEEKLMQKANYPDFHKHKHRHDNFNTRLNQLAAELNGLVELYDYAVRLNLWLVEWYYAELRHDDMRMSAFLKRKKRNKLLIYSVVGGICLVISLGFYFLC